MLYLQKQSFPLISTGWTQNRSSKTIDTIDQLLLVHLSSVSRWMGYSQLVRSIGGTITAIVKQLDEHQGLQA